MEIELENVCVDYDKYRAVSDVSLRLGAGEILSVIGPNGSGKSTLIKAIAGILRLSAGHVRINGRDLDAMGLGEVARLIGYVPQSVPATYHSTVTDAVLLGRKPYVKWGVSWEDLDIADRAMKAMGIDGLADKLLGELSGGERQKVIIARALAQEPGAFLFDEPTNNLDLRHQIDVLEMARALACRKGTPLLVALHDLNLAYTYSDRVVILSQGHVRAAGRPADVLTVDNIRDVYGVEVAIHEWAQGKYIVPARAQPRPVCPGGF